MLQIGDTLREARRRRGLELPACEAGTKIRAKYLVALEEEQFEIMPEPTYVRGFLRTYAEFLGVDPRPLLEEYGDRIAPDSDPAPDHEVHSLTAEGGPPGESRRPMLLPSLPPRPDRRLVLLAVGGLAVLAVLLWLGLGGGGGSSQDASLPSLPPVTRPVHHTSPAAPPTPAPAARPRPTGVRLVLAGTEGTNGSYVDIHVGGQAGPRIFEGTIAAGEKRSWHASGALWMRVGWTPNLVVRLNGRPVPISGGTADFTVRRRGLTQAT